MNTRETAAAISFLIRNILAGNHNLALIEISPFAVITTGRTIVREILQTRRQGA